MAYILKESYITVSLKFNLHFPDKSFCPQIGIKNCNIDKISLKEVKTSGCIDAAHLRLVPHRLKLHYTYFRC